MHASDTQRPVAILGEGEQNENVLQHHSSTRAQVPGSWGSESRLWAVRRRLAEGGLAAHRPATLPKVTPAYREAPLQFPREHEHWTMGQR